MGESEVTRAPGGAGPAGAAPLPRSRARGLGRGLVVLAAAGLLLVLVRFGTPVVGPFLLALFFATLCRPIQQWLQARRVPAGLALVLVALGLVGTVLLLAGIVGLSVAQLIDNIHTYQNDLAAQLAGLQAPLAGLRAPLAALGIDASALRADSGALAATVMDLILALAGSLGSLALDSVYVLVTILFLLADGPRLVHRATASLGAGHPVMARLTGLGPDLVRYFGLRTYLNALTGLGIGVALFLLGVDYAALWGVLLFFLSYVPYIGIFLASAPPVVLTLAVYGPARAVLVVLMITVINLGLENLLMPRMVGRGLRLSPLIVFVSFFFWTWLLGAAGALLAMFLTLLVVVILDSFEETRWLADAIVAPPSTPGAPAGAGAGDDARIPPGGAAPPAP